MKFHARTKASMGGALAGIDAPRRPNRSLPVQTALRTLAPAARRHRGAHPREAHLSGERSPDEPRQTPSQSAPGPSSSPPIGRAPRSGSLVIRRTSRRGLSYVDELVMRVIPDAGTQVLALENGEVDFLWGVPGPDQGRLKADPVFAWRRLLSPRRIELHHDRQLQPRASDPQGRACPPGDRTGTRPRSLPSSGALRRRPGRYGAHLQRDGVGHAAVSTWPSFDRAEAERLLDAAGWKRERDTTRVARGVSGVPEGTRLAIDFLHFPAFRNTAS